MASTEVPYRHEMSGHCGSGALRDLIPDAPMFRQRFLLPFLTVGGRGRFRGRGSA